MMSLHDPERIAIVNAWRATQDRERAEKKNVREAVTEREKRGRTEKVRGWIRGVGFGTCL